MTDQLGHRPTRSQRGGGGDAGGSGPPRQDVAGTGVRQGCGLAVGVEHLSVSTGSADGSACSGMTAAAGRLWPTVTRWSCSRGTVAGFVESSTSANLTPRSASASRPWMLRRRLVFDGGAGLGRSRTRPGWRSVSKRRTWRGVNRFAQKSRRQASYRPRSTAGLVAVGGSGMPATRPAGP